MNDFQSQCVQFIRQFASRRLLKGQGRQMSAEAEAALTAKPTWMSRGIGLAAALLTSPPWQDQPSNARPVGEMGADALGDYACRVADVFASELIARCSGPTFPPNFEMLTLVPMIELLLPRATGRQRRLWLRAANVCARVSRAFLLSKEPVWGRPGPFTGCGPNHLFIVAAPLYRLGRLLGQADDCRLARRAMHRLCTQQADEGYFPEDTGPAVNYQRVYLFGLCDYHATSGDRFVEPFIARGIEFIARAMYTNLEPIETIDQRNRTGNRIGQADSPGRPFDACFGRNPLGRRLAERVIAALLARLDREPGKVALTEPGLVALAALNYCDGPKVRALPCQRKAYVERIDDKAGIVRRDGWLVALSGYYHSNRPGNPFILDRSTNISLFHDRFGLILGGGNDKHKFDAATIELAESGYVHYFPPIGGTASVFGGRGGQVDLEYGPAVGRIRVTIRSPRLVELIAGAQTTFSDQVNWLNLQIPVGPGATVRIDGRRVRLDKKATDVQTRPVKKWFEPIDGVLIEVVRGGEFRWPVLPWNSYNIPSHTSPIAAATGYLRLSLSGQRLDERVVRIHVR